MFSNVRNMKKPIIGLFVLKTNNLYRNSKKYKIFSPFGGRRHLLPVYATYYPSTPPIIHLRTSNLFKFM
jgi:hypothetical protein